MIGLCLRRQRSCRLPKPQAKRTADAAATATAATAAADAAAAQGGGATQDVVMSLAEPPPQLRRLSGAAACESSHRRLCGRSAATGRRRADEGGGSRFVADAAVAEESDEDEDEGNWRIWSGGRRRPPPASSTMARSATRLARLPPLHFAGQPRGLATEMKAIAQSCGRWFLGRFPTQRQRQPGNDSDDSFVVPDSCSPAFASASRSNESGSGAARGPCAALPPYGREVLGRRVDVLFDRTDWYAGVVSDFRRCNGEHLLLYDNGTGRHALHVDEGAGQLRWATCTALRVGHGAR